MNMMRIYDFMAIEMLLAHDQKQINDTFYFIELFGKESNEHADEARNLKSYYLAINDLFQFNLTGCLHHINESNNFPSKISLFQEKRLLLTSFLHSLEFFGDLNKDELKFQNKIYLAGARLELASNFIKGEAFDLSNKWSKKPTFYYFDRVLYCLWLYERNELLLLANSLKTIINSKLGNAYFQSFLKKLEIKMNEKLSQ